ncbi:hypothetical protein HGG76_23395 [Ochrobactrum tritici]|uniref:Uncharacterized protein n=1 Tax=Brucella tritici TaxID=94626 RepID=A0A7X6FSJ5_9HYPH|nr:hypothetical protein [Brucella tritici]
MTGIACKMRRSAKVRIGAGALRVILQDIHFSIHETGNRCRMTGSGWYCLLIDPQIVPA